MKGIVCDALNPGGAPTPAELRAIGADGARLVAFDDDRFYAYHDTIKAAGLWTAVVLARETFGDAGYNRVSERLAARCEPTWWLVGNEADAGLLPVPSPSSWAMEPSEYVIFWRIVAWQIRQVQPDAQLVIAGQVSGQLTWLEEALPLIERPTALDAHPYGKSVAEARALIRSYKALGLPVTVMEWSRAAVEMPGYLAMLEEEALAAAFFCYSESMVPGFGLIEDPPSLAAFRAASASVEPSYSQPTEEPMADQTPAEAVDALITSLGTAKVGQVYRRATLKATSGPYPKGSSFAWCDGGRIEAIAGVPGAYLLPDASRLASFR